MSSSRAFLVAGFESGYFFKKKISLKKLLKIHKDTYEYIYALQEETDKILDLKINETLSVSLNRDNSDCKGVICRIS